MTDDELLELLERKTPEELSPDEIDLLRARLADSPQVREALAARLRLEADLAASLGRMNLSVDDLLAESRGRREDLFWPIVGLLGCLLLVAVTAAAMYVTSRRDAAHEQVAAGEDANADADAASDDESADADEEQPGDDGSSSVTPAAAVKLPLLLSAAEFKQGNVDVDREELGTAEQPVLASGDQLPPFVEYEFDLPQAGPHRLQLRYAAFDSRPLTLTINGEQAKLPVAGEQTGDNRPESQRWTEAGVHEFSAGRNVLRLSTSFKFPHLSELKIDRPPVVAAVDPMEPTNPTAPDGSPATGQPPGVDAPPPTPWDAVVQADEIPTFAESCFTGFNREVSLPRRDDLQQWVAPVDGFRYTVSENDTRYGRCASIDGLVRWKSPWLDDSALRLSLENYHRLKIHFFHGTQGVTLAYYESERFRWSAYSTTRKPGAARPEKFLLTANDAWRCDRTEIRFGGAFEIRYRDGEIILSRGDIELLRAPLPGPPEEVYLDGRAVFHGIEFVRASDYPAPPAPLPVTLEVERPADLPWQEKLSDKSRVERLDNGAIRLISDASKTNSWITTPVPRQGLHFIELEVEGATPGSGVYLGRDEGEATEVLRFARHRRDGALGVILRGNGDLREHDFGNINDTTIPYVSPERLWIRLLFGCGDLRWWISTDGVHWAEPDLPVTDRQGNLQFIGLNCVARAPDCGVTLRRIRLRELPELAGLAPRELQEQALEILGETEPGKWRERLAASKPADVDEADWRRASALAILSRGTSQRDGHELLELLLDDPVVLALPPERRFDLLDEASLVSDTRSHVFNVDRLIGHYFDVAYGEQGQVRFRPYSLVRRPLMMSPMLSVRSNSIVDLDLMRLEIIELTYAQAWRELFDFCRLLRFYHQEREAPLVEWAEATAVSNGNLQASAGDVSRMKDEWRQPVVEEFSKQAYNVMAELGALLSSDAHEAAARMVTSLDPETLSGVAPAAHDRQLLVSLPAAVRLAIRRHPQLADVIQQKYGPLAQLRIRQAIATGDTQTVELAAVQFESTDAAAEARQWLGDRALAAGWFARAEAEYRRAEQTAGVLMRKGLEARLRLAAAMQGRDEGPPATATVQIGEMLLSANDFETLVEEMRLRGAASSNGDASAGLAQQPLPNPGGEFDVKRLGRLDGPVGSDPNAEKTRHVRRHHVPWVDRQLATTVAGDQLFVSNRFQVSAYDLKSGKRLWRSETPSGSMMHSQDWSLTPMTPLVAGAWVYARMLYGDSPAIVALERETGKIAWTARRPMQESFVSDPLLAQGRLTAFSLVTTEQRESVLRLITLDIATGETETQQDLLRVRDSWWTRRYCMAASLDDCLVANLGGAALCCDLNGHVRWVRREWVMPAEEETTWVEQRFQSPRLYDGRLYLAQAGVRSIECVAPETGDRVWSLVLPNVQGIAGIAGGTVVLQTDEGFLAVDAVTGEELWRCAADDRLDALACDDEHLLFTRRVIPEGEKPGEREIVELNWISLEDGRVVKSVELGSLRDKEVHLGGLFSHNDKLFAFYGFGADRPERELIEVSPK